MPNNKKYKGFFLQKYRVWHHILFWIATLIFEIFLYHIFSINNSYFYLIVNSPISMLLVYFNLYVLIRHILPSGKSIKFIFLTIVSIFIAFISSVIIIELINIKSFETDWSWHALSVKHALSLLFLIVVLISAIAFHLFKEQINSLIKIDVLEKLKLEAELDFLKMQMNPHFLFNTLNGISTLTKTNPDKAYDTIILLSDLLRYQTYECSGNLVLLSSEIKYLQQYLSLQSIRFPKAKIEFEIKGEITGLTIFPFIFSSFVENAVKHGIEKVKDNAYIRIVIEIMNNKVVFFVENTKTNQQETKNSGGVGLRNVKRRLDLLYSKKYKLEIVEEENLYIVKLKLNLAQ